MKVLHEFPAYNLIEPARSYYSDRNVIALPYFTDPAKQAAKRLFRFFTFGSVAGCAIERGACPEAELAQ